MTQQSTAHNQDFHLRLTVNAPAKDVLKKIGRVDLWWAKNFQGRAEKPQDKFIVRFGDTFVDFVISEFIPEKKIVWRVTDCQLDWIKDKQEWKNTDVIWTLSEKDGKTRIEFVHKRLTPESECYDSCEAGWTHHLKDSLVKLIEEGKGFPE